MAENRLEHLLQNRPALSTKQIQLLDYLLHNINHMSNTSVAEVAKQSGVGKATIFRMLRMAGYESFLSFKLDLAAYVSKNTPPPCCSFLSNNSPAAANLPPGCG